MLTGLTKSTVHPSRVIKLGLRVVSSWGTDIYGGGHRRNTMAHVIRALEEEPTEMTA